MLITSILITYSFCIIIRLSVVKLAIATGLLCKFLMICIIQIQGVPKKVPSIEIIALLSSTGFHAPGNKKFNSIALTHSCVQHSAYSIQIIPIG